jgi:hypothetical protein
MDKYIFSVVEALILRRRSFAGKGNYNPLLKGIDARKQIYLKTNRKQLMNLTKNIFKTGTRFTILKIADGYLHLQLNPIMQSYVGYLSTEK